MMLLRLKAIVVDGELFAAEESIDVYLLNLLPWLQGVPPVMCTFPRVTISHLLLAVVSLAKQRVPKYC